MSQVIEISFLENDLLKPVLWNYKYNKTTYLLDLFKWPLNFAVNFGFKWYYKELEFHKKFQNIQNSQSSINYAPKYFCLPSDDGYLVIEIPLRWYLFKISIRNNCYKYVSDFFCQFIYKCFCWRFFFHLSCLLKRNTNL